MSEYSLRPITEMAAHVVKHLRQRDVDMMKMVLAFEDKLSARKYEEITSAPQLFVELKKQMLLREDDTRLLISLLRVADRLDLVEKVREFDQSSNNWHKTEQNEFENEVTSFSDHGSEAATETPKPPCHQTGRESLSYANGITMTEEQPRPEVPELRPDPLFTAFGDSLQVSCDSTRPDPPFSASGASLQVSRNLVKPVSVVLPQFYTKRRYTD